MNLLNTLGITSSKGVFRTVASVLLMLSALPQLSEYNHALVELATWLGGLGVMKAMVSK